MKIIYCVLFFLIQLLCFAQDSDIEALLNVAYKEAVPKSFTYFNLVDSSFVMTVSRNLMDKGGEDKVFIRNNPGFTIEEFTAPAQKIDWAKYAIEKAVIYPYQDIPKFAGGIRISRIVPYKTPKHVLDSLNRAGRPDYNELYVPVKKHWGEKKITKVCNAAWQDYEKGVRPEDRVYFKFSTPLFSSDRKYALIQLNTSGGGAYYVFKKANGTWSLEYKFKQWVN